MNVNFYNAEDLPAVPFLINIVNPGFGIQSFTATNTTVYILNAVNRNDADDIDSDTITINVIEPRPTIELKSDKGNMALPETEITFTAEQPSSPALSENFPNPFSHFTLLEYSLPEPGHVLLEVYDISGKKVATLVDEHTKTGVYRCRFVAGENLSGGVYFARMTVNHDTFTRRMVLR